MSQLCLVFAAPYSAAGPSKEAAKAIEPHLDRLERIVLSVIALGGDSGRTDGEIEQMAGLAGNTVRPRRVRLVEKGLVRDSGARRRTPSGRPATVWVLTEHARRGHAEA